MKYHCVSCYQPATKRCFDCHVPLCGKHAYFRVDGNNIAITRNAPILCQACYEKRYGKIL